MSLSSSLSPPPATSPRASTCSRCAAGSPPAAARPRRLTTSRSRTPPRDRLGQPRRGAAPPASSTATGNGGACFTPRRRGRMAMTPLTAGANPATTSRTAVGKTLTPRRISMSSVRPMQRTRGLVRPQAQGAGRHPHMVAAAEAQQRRRPLPQMGIDQLPLRPVLPGPRRAGLRVDQLHMHEAPPGEVHARPRLALAPERHRDVADPHRLGHLRPPGRLQPPAQLRLPAARLARDQQPRHARAREVDARARPPSRPGAARRRASAPPRPAPAPAPPPAAARCSPAPPGCGRPRAPRRRRAPRPPRTAPRHRSRSAARPAATPEAA